MPALLQTLTELGSGVPIFDALGRNTEPIEKLDEEFAAFIKTKAQELAPKADWERPKMAGDDAESLAGWMKDHPNSFWGLLAQAQSLMTARKFDEAKAPLEAVIALY